MNMHLDNSYLDVLGQINLDELYIRQTFDYYQQQFNLSPLAKQFVSRSCRIAGAASYCYGNPYRYRLSRIAYP